MIKNKVIVVISHQKWGNMFLSKHNYALELAEHNEVYFLESPDENHKSKITILDSNESPSLKIIKNGITNTYRYRYLGNMILEKAIKNKVKKIKKAISKKIDVIFSFDDYGFYPFLEQFDSGEYIYIPVDAPASPLVKLIKYPNPFIFSISKEVAEKYHFLDKKSIILNHGLSKYWQNIAEINIKDNYQPNPTLKFGFVGNLLKGKIQDTETLKRVIEKFSTIEFHFWGPYEQNQSNVGAKQKEDTGSWIVFLKSKSNVFLHGVLHPKELVHEANKMDGYFICKNDMFDRNKSSNSHKIMEYLSTGKVVVSSHLSAYLQLPNYVAMPSTTSNDNYINIFEEVINDITFYNSEELKKSRINFVLEHTYAKNIERIFQVLST